MPRVPGSKAKNVYSGAGFCQELISDRACLLTKVHLVYYYKSLGTSNFICDPLHEEFQSVVCLEKFHDGWWYIAIIESALGPDLVT